MTDATSGAGPAHPSGASAFSPMKYRFFQNPLEVRTQICQFKDLITSVFSSGNMQNEIIHVGERPKINEP